MRHAERHQLGAVTIVRSKKRRPLGPKRVKIIVTHRLDVSASAVISPIRYDSSFMTTSEERYHVGFAPRDSSRLPICP